MQPTGAGQNVVAEEDNCFETLYPFVNDQGQFWLFRQQDPHVHYLPHEGFLCTVRMLAGLPGSGKDTWLTMCRAMQMIAAYYSA